MFQIRSFTSVINSLKIFYTITLGSFLLVFLFINACQNEAEKAKSQKNTPSQQQKSSTSLTTQNLRDASLQGNIQKVRKAIDQGIDVNASDQANRTPLMLAAFNGHRKIVQLLLEKGANIEDRNADGRTALIFASSGSFPKTVELLLENKADPNATDTVDGWSALMFAAAEGQKEVVQTLLDANADPTLTDKEGDTALDFARNNNHPEVASLLEEETN